VPLPAASGLRMVLQKVCSNILVIQACLWLLLRCSDIVQGSAREVQQRRRRLLYIAASIVLLILTSILVLDNLALFDVQARGSKDDSSDFEEDDTGCEILLCPDGRPFIHDSSSNKSDSDHSSSYEDDDEEEEQEEEEEEEEVVVVGKGKGKDKASLKGKGKSRGQIHRSYCTMF
jgi:hypothetical protein